MDRRRRTAGARVGRRRPGSHTHTTRYAPPADADPFDLLCHVAFNAPLRTRRERAEALRREQEAFFDGYGPKAHEVLYDILEKYIDYGVAQFQIPEILKVPPISERGTVMEIAAMFGGAEKLRGAVNQLQALLYA
ncbi:MAG TPA: type I restriction-modification enzyme R subunit C-terminal domain-containing protein [Terriglobia bacterium]|nr:type I restriction-modification enzyme R subunit C-terminal domain-containing protein [Terriglobia bacterium]